jgi:hypothetical protein
MHAREIKTSDKVIALGLALCATVATILALAAPANADTYSNGFKLSKFKVEVKGWQKMVQQNSHQSENECDGDDFSSGSEMLNFRTTKPMVITAYYSPGQDNPEFFAGKRLGIPTKATIKRSYTPRRTMSFPEECGANGGGVDTVTQPDCGTKTASPFQVNLQYSRTKKNGLLLSSESTIEDPFKECPGAGLQSFPWLIVEDTKNRYITADLSQKELFDPKFQKWISIAEGTDKTLNSRGWVKTTVRWEVSFTRLKNKVPGA